MAATPDAPLGTLNWSDYQTVLVISRAGSLRATAKVLAINEATASRHLARIEHACGQPLFCRENTGLTTTPAGDAMVRLAEKLEATLLSEQPSTPQAATIRVTAVPTIINQWLLPAAGDLLNSQPHIRLMLIAEQNSLNLGRQDADLAIRLARPVDDHASQCKKMGELEYATFVNKAQTTGKNAWIDQQAPRIELPQHQIIASELIGSPARLICNNGESVLAATRLGYGRALLPVAIARQLSELQHCPEGPKLKREVWLLTRPGLYENADVHQAKEWLIDTLSPALI